MFDYDIFGQVAAHVNQLAINDIYNPKLATKIKRKNTHGI